MFIDKPESASGWEEDVEDRLDHIALSLLRPLALAFALLFSFFAVAYYLTLQASVSWPIALLALFTSLVFGLVHVATRQTRIPPARANLIIAGMVSLGLLNLLLYLHLTEDIWQTTSLIMLMFVASFLVMSWRWLVAILVITLLGWALVVTRVGPSSVWRPLLFAVTLTVVMSVVINVAQRRLFRRLLRSRVREEKQKLELQRRARQLETSTAIGRQLAALRDLNPLLDEIVLILKKQYDAYFVGVFLFDETGEFVVARAGTGRPGRALRDAGFRLRVGEEGLVGWVAAKGKAVRVDDVSEDERFVGVDVVPATRSEMALPLQVHGHLLGVLDIQSQQVAAFSADDVPFLQSLADQVATAIHNASLYQQAQTDRDRAQMLQSTGRTLTETLDLQKVLDLILTHLHRAVPFDRGAILLERQGSLQMAHAHGFPDGWDMAQVRIPIKTGDEQTIYHQIYRSREPLILDDVSSKPDWQNAPGLELACTWMALPLIHAGDVIGILSLVRETPVTYTDEEVIVATSFAGQATVALENARLYQQLMDFNRKLEDEVKQRTQSLQDAYERLEMLDRQKSDFIQVVSHELRTPVTIVSSNSQMLLRLAEQADKPRMVRLARGIENGVERMQEIIETMLDLVRIDSGSLRINAAKFRLPSIFERLAHHLGQALTERDLRLVVDDDFEDLPPVEGDIDNLYKVFYHLLINAIKYTPDGGTIVVTGHSNAMNPDLDQGAVEVIIKDTGIGIDPGVHDLIFSKFYRTGEVAFHSSSRTDFKGGGAGLGLAIVRGIVGAHHGRVWVESEGHDEEGLPGSEFHVLLPLQQPQPAGDD